jgi:hypothetical protein
MVVGALSIVGLVAALIGDGWWDVLSWFTLTVPVLLYVFFLARRKRARQAQNP